MAVVDALSADQHEELRRRSASLIRRQAKRLYSSTISNDDHDENQARLRAAVIEYYERHAFRWDGVIAVLTSVVRQQRRTLARADAKHHRRFLPEDVATRATDDGDDTAGPSDWADGFADMSAEPSTATPEQHAMANELLAEVHRWFALLSERDRLIVRRRIAGASFPEIAAAVGMTEATVRQRHGRALRPLRTTLTDLRWLPPD